MNEAHRTTIAFHSAVPIADIDRDFGDYELIDRLAEGGMGVVYRALDRKLQRIIALKMIKGERVADSVAIERFYIEARSAASLRHPHIVAIHNVGEHAGRHFFTMDLIDGRSLADVVDEGLLAPKRAARYVRIAADAIEFAHRNDVLHRDIKPANILIDANDQPMVTDFGLARPIDPGSGVTATGAILGTPSYMSPEQASPGRIPLTAASDVYSLGATLYELVTGRPPFRGESLLDTLMQVVSMEPVSPRLLNPQVSRDLETIILKCLAKEPARRYPDAQSLSDDLGHFERGEPIVARPPSAIERASRWLRHQQPRVLLGLGAVLFTVLLLVGGTLGWSAYQESRLGNLRLLSEQFGLEAEVFDDKGNLVVPARSLPTCENIVLPTGFYHIRLSGLHQLSETYHLQLEAGERLDTQLTLTDRHLWEPLTGHTSSNLFTTSDRTDIIIHSSGQMREVNNRNGLDAWAITLTAETAPAGWDLDLWRNAFLVGAPEGRPSLVQPAPDLNGDGRPDLVWGLRQLPSLIAMNGHSGQILWSFIPKEEDGIAKKFSGWGHIVGSPAMHEIDGDGVVDFIGVFSTRHESKNQLIAISGKTGKQLWSRWLPGPWKSQLQPDFYEKLLGPEGSRSPELITLGDQRIASLVAGDHLVSVDVKTGELVADHDLGFLPYRPGQFADLDGDGRPEVLVMRREKIQRPA